MKKLLLLAFIAMSSLWMNAQWYEFGNSGLNENNDFLGTTDNDGVTFRTDDLMRMRLYKQQTNTINNFPLIDQSGFVAISGDPNFFPNTIGAFTRLHLADETEGLNSEEAVYREWMKNGITMTGNGDGMYVGQRYWEENYTDATITWSDNPGAWLRDRLTFNFNSAYTNDEVGCGSLNGLQTMVIQPHEECRESFVGIGDFDAVTETPDERLDVLDRTVRIRRLVPDYQDVFGELDRFVVTDPDGRLHWRYLSNLPDNCEWSLVTSGTHALDVYTAVGTSTTCPDDNNEVGIGTISPDAKLEVHRKPTPGDEIGIWARTTTDANYSGPNSVAYGLRDNAILRQVLPVHPFIVEYLASLPMRQLVIMGFLDQPQERSPTQQARMGLGERQVVHRHATV